MSGAYKTFLMMLLRSKLEKGGKGFTIKKWKYAELMVEEMSQVFI